MSRKLSLVLGLLLLASLVITACAPAAAPTPTQAPKPAATTAAPAAAATPTTAAKPAAEPTKPAAAAPKPPLKIGAIMTFSGTFAGYANDWMDGFKLRLGMLGNKLGGRDVQIIVDDDGGDVNMALAKMKKQVEQDKVEILVSSIFQSMNNASDEYLSKQDLLNILPGLGSFKNPNKIGLVMTVEGQGDAMGKYAYQKLGYRKVINWSLVTDNGTRYMMGFKKAFTDLGGTIVGEVTTPQGTADYGPFVASAPTNADAVNGFLGGVDSIRFVQARYQAGLRDKLPLIGSNTTDDALVKEQGEAAIGVININDYFNGMDNPTNQAYKKAYAEKYNKPADSAGALAPVGYTAGQLLDEALKMTDGKAQPVSQLLAAIKKLKFEAPTGAFSYGADVAFPVKDMPIMKAASKDGKMSIQLLDTVKDVKPWVATLP